MWRNEINTLPIDRVFGDNHINERVIVAFDGSNFFGTVRMLPTAQRFNFEALRFALMDNCRLIRLNYYTAIIRNDDGHDHLRPLIDYLSYNGYNVVSKDGKKWETNDGETKKKGNMDVEIAVDMMASIPNVDHIILATGDGDFCALVRKLQDAGKRVTLLSSIKTSRPICSDELRRQVDNFIDIADLIIEPEFKTEVNSKIISQVESDKMDIKLFKPLLPGATYTGD